MISVKFTIKHNNKDWVWNKTFYCAPNLLNTHIQNYLDKKEFSFGFSKNDVTWKII